MTKQEKSRSIFGQYYFALTPQQRKELIRKMAHYGVAYPNIKNWASREVRPNLKYYRAIKEATGKQPEDLFMKIQKT